MLIVVKLAFMQKLSETGERQIIQSLENLCHSMAIQLFNAASCVFNT